MLGTRRVQHRQDVGRLRLQVRWRHVAGRGAEAAPVVEDYPRELSRSDHERPPVRFVPHQVDVAFEIVKADRNVDWSFTDRLPGNVDVIGRS